MPTDLLDELRIALADGGVPAALALLNSRTACRFTSMYRFDRDMLRTLTFYDRANPTAIPPDDIPVEVSYCVFVRESGRPFRVENSLGDFRVELHPKRLEIQSYVGVPLEDGYGLPVGTLCHFDLQPGAISEETVRLMEDFAKLFREHLAGKM